MSLFTQVLWWPSLGHPVLAQRGLVQQTPALRCRGAVLNGDFEARPFALNGDLCPLVTCFTSVCSTGTLLNGDFMPRPLPVGFAQRGLLNFYQPPAHSLLNGLFNAMLCVDSNSRLAECKCSTGTTKCSTGSLRSGLWPYPACPRASQSCPCVPQPLTCT
jgi:hypothetical protein